MCVLPLLSFGHGEGFRCFVSEEICICVKQMNILIGEGVLEDIYFFTRLLPPPWRLVFPAHTCPVHEKRSLLSFCAAPIYVSSCRSGSFPSLPKPNPVTTSTPNRESEHVVGVHLSQPALQCALAKG